MFEVGEIGSSQKLRLKSLAMIAVEFVEDHEYKLIPHRTSRILRIRSDFVIPFCGLISAFTSPVSSAHRDGIHRLHVLQISPRTSLFMCAIILGHKSSDLVSEHRLPVRIGPKVRQITHRPKHSCLTYTCTLSIFVAQL
jgi:hypothetical protein